MQKRGRAVRVREGLSTLLFLMPRAVSVHYSWTVPWKSTLVVIQVDTEPGASP